MADFKVGEVVGGFIIKAFATVDNNDFYILSIPGSELPTLSSVKEFDEKYSKKLAMAKIQDKIDQMKVLLREAQQLADDHSLTFKVALDYATKDQNDNWYDRGGGTPVQGKYIGKGSDGVEDGQPYPKQGRFYWQNSSLNC